MTCYVTILNMGLIMGLIMIFKESFDNEKSTRNFINALNGLVGLDSSLPQDVSPHPFYGAPSCTVHFLCHILVQETTLSCTESRCWARHTGRGQNHQPAWSHPSELHWCFCLQPRCPPAARGPQEHLVLLLVVAPPAEPGVPSDFRILQSTCLSFRWNFYYICSEV